MEFENKLSELIDQLEAREDSKALQSLLDEGFEKGNDGARPFTANMRMKPDFQAKHLEGGVEGARGLNWINKIASALRRTKFRKKIKGGFDGLVLAEEGDSWTQYPVLLQDIVDHLGKRDDIAIYSVGAAGDLVKEMAQEKEYLRALEKSGATGLLLSGGGNDLLGDGRLESVLLPFAEGSAAEDLLNSKVLEGILLDVIGDFQTILNDIATAHPGVTVFSHGYDLPHPDAGGKWLGTPMEQQGIPLGLGRDILKIIIDRFNEGLLNLEEANTNFVYTDLRGVVDRGQNSWFDELHPRNAGYGRAADALRASIETTLDSQSIGVEQAMFETSGSGVVVLDPGHGGTSKVGGSRPNNAVGPKGTLEKQLTLDVGLRCKTILESRGFEVALTRDSDVNLGLTDRAEVAKNLKASAFVSIHFNGFDGRVQGTETFVHRRGTSASDALCRAVQAEMVLALGHRDRNASSGGVKTAGFGVLNPADHDADTAAVLHEVSFMDVASEEDRLLKVSYRQKIAQALADGIEGYLSAAGLGVESFSEEEMEDGFDVAHVHEMAPSRSIGHRAFGGHMIAETEGATWLRDAARDLAHPGPLNREDDQNDTDEFAGMPMEWPAFAVETPRFETALRDLERHFGGVESAGFDYDAFDAFIAGLGLTYFKPVEFLTMGGGNTSGKCAGQNSLPPKSLWPNLAKSARMLDEIRRRLGAPITITSAYRSASYNACVKGKPSSLHRKFNALDWVCASGTAAQWHSVATAVRASASDFSGGIGRYSSFVHIDTRGTNADW